MIRSTAAKPASARVGKSLDSIPFFWKVRGHPLPFTDRKGPLVLARVVDDLLQQRELLLSDVPSLSEVVPPAILPYAGFWVIGRSTYDRTLVEELEQLQKRPFADTALAFLFEPPKMGRPAFEDVRIALANPINPTLSQAIALAAAMRQPLTVITGPPGTGKTRVIVGLIIHHLLSGRSLLLVSRINRAVDAAVELAERLMGRGCVLRTAMSRRGRNWPIH